MLSFVFAACDLEGSNNNGGSGTSGWVDNDRDDYDDNTNLDRDGYDRDGWKDGEENNTFTGTKLDNEGYDRDGWKVGVENNKFTNTNLDRDGYSRDGWKEGEEYNKFTGKDRDGNIKIEPVAKAALWGNGSPEAVNEQTLVYVAMSQARTNLNKQAVAVAKLFNDYSECSKPALREKVHNAQYYLLIYHDG